jgi:uncharacterized membrane protein
MIALTLQVTLFEAFAMDIGLSVFFLVYNYVYNLIFDAVFGLPASAMPVATASEREPRA